MLFCMLSQLTKQIIWCAMSQTVEQATEIHSRVQNFIATQQQTPSEIVHAYTSATIIALRHGRHEVAGMFWPMAQLTTDDLSEVFCSCVDWDYLECVKLLFPHCQHIPMEHMMVVAAKKGSIVCLEWLLAHVNVDPMHNHSEALVQACYMEHNDCVDVLYPLSNPQEALDHLQLTYPNFPAAWAHLEEKMMDKQHTTLEQVVLHQGTSTPQRKM